jgi:hypothetical protein
LSGALLFRSALQRVVRLQLHEAAERDLVAALGAGSRSTLQFFYDAAVEAGLESAARALRGVARSWLMAPGERTSSTPLV